MRGSRSVCFASLSFQVGEGALVSGEWGHNWKETKTDTPLLFLTFLWSCSIFVVVMEGRLDAKNMYLNSVYTVYACHGSLYNIPELQTPRHSLKC